MSTTSVSPDARRIWRAARIPVAILVVLVLGAVFLVLVRGDADHGALEPGAADPQGSRALAKLLEAQGVRIETARTAGDAERALTGPGGATLLVTAPDLVDPPRLAGLRQRAAETVLIAPNQPTLDAVRPGTRVVGSSEVSVRSPDCTIAAAVAAGDAVLGGTRYHAGPRDRRCYGDALVQVSDERGHTILLGAGAPLTNERLAEQGNAALAMRLLGGHQRLVWYLPSPGDPAMRAGERPLTELIPPGWIFGAVQLAVACVLFGLWRARRLGPVVAEPLPAVVRAAETTEGRARLYRRSGAAGHAATLLRQATLHRLEPVLGLGTGAEPAAVVAALAARSGRNPAELGALLYGPPPETDPGLVRLAGALDELEKEVTGS
ncbi:DUF4350 domain-containing protein [Amycolatopsis anabasis]|uniref:DUF4350 domain-containing protein n=1 Tax=Amycolatopsis anabasis TaxID=1840409 RepID=UPI0015D3127D|nr:DUF4350 domain-containing protein [Amycolatopsis anabasis]